MGGDGAVGLDGVAGESGGEVDAGPATHPVAQKKPNALGLYDMLGNAAEWTKWMCRETKVAKALSDFSTAYSRNSAMSSMSCIHL